MATYIGLANFTEQGISTIKDTTKRADAAKEFAGKFGVHLKDVFWTMGQYDLIALCEAEDEASMLAFGLAINSAGNIRMQTLKAFSKDDMNIVLGKMG